MSTFGIPNFFFLNASAVNHFERPKAAVTVADPDKNREKAEAHLYLYFSCMHIYLFHYAYTAFFCITSKLTSCSILWVPLLRKNYVGSVILTNPQLLLLLLLLLLYTKIYLKTSCLLLFQFLRKFPYFMQDLSYR